MGTYDIMTRMDKTQDSINEVTRRLLQLAIRKQETNAEQAAHILKEIGVPLQEAETQLRRLEEELDG